MNKESRLVFTTNSPVYHYLNWIRSFYGADSTNNSSLCPAFHTMLWGSIGLIILLPLSLIGNIVKKIYTTLIKDKDSRSICMSNGESLMSEKPWIVGLVFTGMCAASAVVVFCLISVVSAALYGIGSLSNAWDSITLGVQSCGFAFCAACSFIGYFMGFCGYYLSQLWEGAVWLFTNGDLWSSIGYYILYSLAVVLSLAGVGITLGISVLMFARLGTVQRAWDNFLYAIDVGTQYISSFIDARTKNFAFTTQFIAKSVPTKQPKEVRKPKPNWYCLYCKHSNWDSFEYCYHCSEYRYPPSKIAKFFKETLFGTARNIGGTTVQTLGFFSLFWEFAKAFKKRACPLVVFVEPEELQKEAIAHAEKAATQRKMRQRRKML